MTELEKRLAEKFSGFLGIDGDGDMYVKGQPFNAALALWRECLKLMERNAELEKLRESDALTAKIEYGNALGCAEAAESENKRLREALENAESERDSLRAEVKDLREEIQWFETDRSRNADRFSREGY